MEVRIDSYDETPHSIERITERIKEMDVMNVGFEFTKGEYTNHGTFTFTDEVKEVLFESVTMMCAAWFEADQDCAILLYDFKLEENFDKINFHTSVHKKDAKRKIAKGNTLFLLSTKSESNGDLLFAVVRKRKFKTLMFVKSYMKNIKKKLRVDVVF